MFLLLAFLGLGALYLYHVNRVMKAVPEEVQRLSPHRWTIDEIHAAYKKNLETPIDVTKSLPPKQSRRYVLVGGTGLVGHWIVSHLLARGEDPAALRILDLLAPEQEILDQGVAYTKTNITDELAVSTAFEEPWPAAVATRPLTVFHTAASISASERFKIFLPLRSKVNIDGTRNVVNAAKKAGATCLIATSSGSIAIHRSSFWVAPWTKTIKRPVQILHDGTSLPQRHDEAFSNYAVTKVEAERIVRAADDAAANFRTGCIRPTNGVYGIGSDVSATVTGAYLRRGGSPTWVRPMIQSFVNAENVSIAHLFYEKCLLEQSQPGSTLPNTGGQAFTVTDPNPAIAFDDIYTLQTTLSKTPISFPNVPALPILLLAHLIELYALVQYRYLPELLPRLSPDLAQLQPALFSVASIHCIADDSRARKSPQLGGLGYSAPLTTLDAMCKELIEWNRRADGKRVAVAGKVGPVSVSEEGVGVNLVSPEKKL